MNGTLEKKYPVARGRWAVSLLAAGTLLISLPGAASEPEVVFVSRPEKAWIYRGELSFLEERADLGRGAGAVIRLPSRTVVDTVSVLAGEKRVKAFSLVPDKTEVATDRGVQTRTTGYLLTLPPGSAGGRKGGAVILRYGVTGLSWSPYLEADIIDGKKVDLTLKAVITNALAGLEDCDITLASAAGPLGGSLYFEHQRYGSRRMEPSPQVRTVSSEAVYEIGRTDLPGEGASTVAVVLSAPAEYGAAYLWDTRTRERVRRKILVRNPFPVPLCASFCRLSRGDLILERGESEWTAPGDRVTFAAGAETGVAVKRAVVTDGNPESKTHPFRHSVAFSLRNDLAEEIKVEVVFGKMPSTHGARTIYHFSREPDRRPGEIFIWEVAVAGDGEGRISFDFDSNRPRYDEYTEYEEALYGD